MKLQGEVGKRWTDCDYRKGLKREEGEPTILPITTDLSEGA